MKDSSAWQTMYFLLKSQKITKKFHYLKIISFPSSELKKKSDILFGRKDEFSLLLFEQHFLLIKRGGFFCRKVI